jgi:hypothetical protein
MQNKIKCITCGDMVILLTLFLGGEKTEDLNPPTKMME